MQDHIGIVACSAEGAALCYRTICAEGSVHWGVHGHPEVSMHTHALAQYLPHIETGDWAGVAELMLSSADKLARAGANFLICPDNTIHAAMPFVKERSKLPWLHIAEVVAARARARGFGCVGITGTRWLTESTVYPDVFDAQSIAWRRPGETERILVNDIIMDELVRGIVRQESVAALVAVIAGLKAAGCDAVVLGCTELPLVIDDAKSPLPTLDSTRLLARAALVRAAG